MDIYSIGMIVHFHLAMAKSGEELAMQDGQPVDTVTASITNMASIVPMFSMLLD